jgi:hypothetical protein
MQSVQHPHAQARNTKKNKARKQTAASPPHKSREHALSVFDAFSTTHLDVIKGVKNEQCVLEALDSERGESGIIEQRHKGRHVVTSLHRPKKLGGAARTDCRQRYRKNPGPSF